MVTNVLLTLSVNTYCCWHHTLLQSRDYDVIRTIITHFAFALNDSVYVHILMHFDKCILKRLKYNRIITLTRRHYYVIHQFS